MSVCVRVYVCVGVYVRRTVVRVFTYACGCMSACV